METETALVGTDGAVELHTVSGIGLDLSLVIHPRHAEGEDAVGFDHAFDYLSLFEFGMLVVNVLDGFQNLLHRLEIFALSRVLGLEPGHDYRCFHYLVVSV